MRNSDATSPGTTVDRTHGAALERASHAYRLRVAGASWDAIARHLGYHDKSAAYNAVKRQFEDAPQPSRELARALHRDRTEALWVEALRDVQARRPGAVRAAVAVLQRVAMLDGLDEPQRVTVTPDVSRVREVVEALAAMARSDDEEADIMADEYAEITAD